MFWKSKTRRGEPTPDPAAESYATGHSETGADDTVFDTRSPDDIREVSQDQLGLCLLGRPKAGKSQLLGSLLRQSRNSVHSFADLSPSFMSSALGQPQVGRNTQELRDLMNDVLHDREFEATLPNEILKYSMQMEWSNPEQGSGESVVGRNSASFDIIDAAGEIIFRSSASGNRPRGIEGEFERTLLNSPGVVYCMPVVDSSTSNRVEDKQVEVLEHFQSDSSDVERVVVVLTKYEQLWVDHGSEAFDLACNKETFLQIARSVLPRPMLSALSDLSQSGIDVCAAPCSAYGFVAANGCANVDPTTGLMLTRTGAAEVSDLASSVPPSFEPSEVTHLWEPFFIVDPFMFAATGERGVLTVDIQEIVQ